MLGVDVIEENHLDKLFSSTKKKALNQSDTGEAKADFEARPAWEMEASVV